MLRPYTCTNVEVVPRRIGRAEQAPPLQNHSRCEIRR
jgi:hypothetical protein